MIPKLIYKYKTVFIIWIIWIVLIYGFQFISIGRISLKGPDLSTGWTGKYTLNIGEDVSLNLRKMFIDSHVSYDSYQYLSIGENGYDDPNQRSIKNTQDKNISINYAFFPMYPYLAKSLSYLFGTIQISNHSILVISGLLINIISSLIASLSLFFISEKVIGKEFSINSVFYFLIFPSSFFMIQFYSEGLYLAFAFLSIALVLQKKYIFSIITISFAIFTRPNGILLIIFFIIEFLNQYCHKPYKVSSIMKILIKLISYIFIPSLLFLIWNFSKYGNYFHFIEKNMFGRSSFNFIGTYSSIVIFFEAISQGNLQSLIYFSIEAVSILIAMYSIIVFLKRKTSLSIYCFTLLILNVGSGLLQSNIRYALAIPTIFLALGTQGKNIVFDKIWTISNLMMLSLLLILFTFNFWVG